MVKLKRIFEKLLFMFQILKSAWPLMVKWREKGKRLIIVFNGLNILRTFPHFRPFLFSYYAIWNMKLSKKPRRENIGVWKEYQGNQNRYIHFIYLCWCVIVTYVMQYGLGREETVRSRISINCTHWIKVRRWKMTHFKSTNSLYDGKIIFVLVYFTFSHTPLI